MSDLRTSRLEDQIRAAMAVPAASDEFVAALRERLRHQAPAIRPRRAGWTLTPLRSFSLGLLVLLLAAILVIGPQRVLAQVLDWLGYVPGVGFVDQEGGLRVLEAPVSQTRDGITITIEDGLIDAERTRLTFFFDGIRQELKSLSEDGPGCSETPSLLLPNGKVYPILEGEGSGGPTWMRQEFRYGTLPLELNEIQVLIPCVPEVRPGAGPEDWVFTIRFVPAPADFEVLPILPLPEVTTTAERAAPHGMQLSVDELVELEDGYLFRGTFTWENSSYEDPEFWDLPLILTDAAGQPIPLKISYELPYGPVSESFFTWTAQTQLKNIASPVTFTVEGMSVRALTEFSDENSFAFDVGDYPQAGQVWPVNKVLDLGGYPVTVSEVTFEALADGTYSLLANLQRDPQQITALNFLDQDNHSSMLWSSSGPGFDYEDGDLLLGIGYDYLPVGVHHFWVDNYFVRLPGPWSATVDLPASSAVDPAPAPQICLTQAAWQQLSLSPAPLSPEASGRVLLHDFTGGGLLPDVRLSGMDGSQPQIIDIGSWAALSPDGQLVAYAHNGLRVVDLASGQSRLLIAEDSSYAIAWAPDSSRLAFIRGGQGLHVINADGTGLRASPGGNANMIGVAGWLPDGARVVVTSISPDGTQVQTVNVDTGEVEDNGVIQNLKGGFASLSPDGTQLAFSESTFGQINYSVYVANLDGTEKRLVAESGGEIAFAAGTWSADSEWLIVNVSPTAGPSYSESPVMLNVATCQTFILPDLAGEIVGWAP